MWRNVKVTWSAGAGLHVLHVFASDRSRSLTSCTRVVPQLTGTIMLNSGRIIMQSIIDIVMTRKRMGECVD
jgi:hypothetical protein